GFTKFVLNLNRIGEVPERWQELLKNVKGVYLLTCKQTGRQYVGSANGEENLWGRFQNYAENGHGGNVELKRRGPHPYQVTVLEIVNSDAEIPAVEDAWKKKLLTREFGLNKN